MKHISKFDNCIYEIAYSASDEDGTPKYDDITLIWKDAPCGVDIAWKEDIPPRELVGWYWGEYDFDLTEGYIKEYYQAKLQPPKEDLSSTRTMDLPICYVHLIDDCLELIKKHNLYTLLSAYQDCPDAAQSHIKEIQERFCQPFDDYGDDAVILLEE